MCTGLTAEEWTEARERIRRVLADHAERGIDARLDVLLGVRRGPLAGEPAAIAIVPPLPDEVEAAHQAALSAYARVEERIATLHRTPAVRALGCGRSVTVHLERRCRARDYQREQHAAGREIDYETAEYECPDAGGPVEEALVRYCCGRIQDAPNRPACWYCRRRRTCRCLRRAASVLLDETPQSRAPRVDPLYLAETTRDRWGAVDRAVRRQHGGECGRLRVRRADDTVLLIAEQPFAGARAVTAAEAIDAAAAAIEQMHDGRHAYRQMGHWRDRQPRRWVTVRRIVEPVDLGAVRAELETAGVRTRYVGRPDLTALVWTVAEGACPSIAIERSGSVRRYSDRPQTATEGGGAPPPEEEYEPGDNPWA